MIDILIVIITLLISVYIFAKPTLQNVNKLLREITYLHRTRKRAKGLFPKRFGILIKTSKRFGTNAEESYHNRKKADFLHRCQP